MDLRDLIVNIVFIGFGILVPVISLFLFSKNTSLKTKIVGLLKSAIIILRIAGVLYILHWLAVELITFTSLDNSIFRRFGGDHWWTILILLVVVPGLTQLYWIKFFQTKILPRILIAILILYFSLAISEKFIIALISLHRDYSDVGDLLAFTYIMEMIRNMIIFIVMVFAVNYFGKKRNNSSSLNQ